MATINAFTIINPLELPSNPNAAALYPANTIVGTNAQWCASPMQTWPDIPTATRTTTAQAALATQQAALQARQDVLNNQIALITAVP
jgi:hypothetical protein